MTREEAIKILKEQIDLYEWQAEDINAMVNPRRHDEYQNTINVLKTAIKALEQEPCEDAINRIFKRMWNCRGKHTTSIDKVKMEQIIRDELSYVTQTLGKWIPVSERLPEEFANVLCSTDSEEIFIATYYGKMNDGTDCFNDHDGMYWEGDVIAWMPLPEPYKTESEDKE